MAVLTYGGIALKVLKTHNIGSEDVYDDTGLDYLWTKYTFDVTGLVNLANTAYATAVGNPNPIATPGTAPFLTVRTIRDTLSLPRQLLTYVDETGNTMVSSPTFGPVQDINFNPGNGLAANVLPSILDCDCDGQGPKPLRPVEVLGVHGAGKSVIVRFAISTTVNDSIFWSAQGGLATPTLKGGGVGGPPINNGGAVIKRKPPILLSNRWSTTEVLDESAFSTRTYTGRAVFRADLLRVILVSPADGTPPHIAVPDDFRKYWAQFFIPDGFQRRQVFVEQDPSGFAVNYRVTDVQLPVTLQKQVDPITNKVGWPACKIEAIATYGMDSLGLEQVTEDAADDLTIGAASFFSSLSGDPSKDATATISAGISFIRGAIKKGASLIARATDGYVITVTGQPGSNRRSLTEMAYLVLFNYLSGSEILFNTTNLTLTVDLMGKWVRLTAVIHRGPIASVIAGDRSNKTAIDMRDRIPVDDSILSGTLHLPYGVTSATPGQQPPYPFALGTRGTALEMMVAQSLMYPYTEAPPPGTHSTAGGDAVLP